MRLHNRLIKGGFWNDPDLLQWPRDKRWFYEGLIQLADDSGCLEDSPFAFKISLFPSPVDSDITLDVLSGWVAELIQQAKLLPYSVNGKQYLYIVNFRKHQQLKDYGAPEVPLPPWITFTPRPTNKHQGSYAYSDPESSVDIPYNSRSDSVEDASNEIQGNTIQGKEIQGKETAASRPRQAREPKQPNAVYAIFAGYCRGLGIEPKMIPKKQQAGYLSVAAGLLEAEYTPAEVEQCTRDLKAQKWWQDKPLHLRNVAQAIPQWKPKGGNHGPTGQSRASPTEADDITAKYRHLDG